MRTDSQRAALVVDAAIRMRLTGDAAGARTLFERALQMDPENTRARDMLATMSAPARLAPRAPTKGVQRCSLGADFDDVAPAVKVQAPPATRAISAPRFAIASRSAPAPEPSPKPTRQPTMPSSLSVAPSTPVSSAMAAALAVGAAAQPQPAPARSPARSLAAPATEARAALAPVAPAAVPRASSPALVSALPPRPVLAVVPPAAPSVPASPALAWALPPRPPPLPAKASAVPAFAAPGASRAASALPRAQADRPLAPGKSSSTSGVLSFADLEFASKPVVSRSVLAPFEAPREYDEPISYADLIPLHMPAESRRLAPGASVWESVVLLPAPFWSELSERLKELAPTPAAGQRRPARFERPHPTKRGLLSPRPPAVSATFGLAAS